MIYENGSDAPGAVSEYVAAFQAVGAEGTGTITALEMIDVAAIARAQQESAAKKQAEDLAVWIIGGAALAAVLVLTV